MGNDYGCFLVANRYDIRQLQDVYSEVDTVGGSLGSVDGTAQPAQHGSPGCLTAQVLCELVWNMCSIVRPGLPGVIRSL